MLGSTVQSQAMHTVDIVRIVHAAAASPLLHAPLCKHVRDIGNPDCYPDSGVRGSGPPGLQMFRLGEERRECGFHFLPYCLVGRSPQPYVNASCHFCYAEATDYND